MMERFSQFVKSLTRLYKFGKIKKEYLDELLTNKKLNNEEYDYIMSQVNKQDN